MNNNKTDFFSTATGGHGSRNSKKGVEIEVPRPQKATGNLPNQEDAPKGFAKASPRYEEVEHPQKKLTKAERRKILEKYIKEIVDDDDSDERNSKL